MRADPLAELRAALDRPDRRGWRRHLAPNGQSAVDAGDEEGPAATPAKRHWGTLLAVGVAGALGVTTVGALRPVSDAAPVANHPTAAAEAPAFAAPATSTPPQTVERLWPAEPVEVRGREVRTAGQRWEVGMEGDIVAVGDWNCDRRRTPAVLRPATGVVAVFDDWDGGTARRVSTVDGATGLVAGPSCGQAELATPDGRARLVDTRRGSR